MSTDLLLGRNSVVEALQSEREIDKIFFAKGVQGKSIQSIIDQVKQRQIPYQWVPRAKLDQLSSGQNHQGIVAHVAAYQYASIESILESARKKKELPFLLILDGIEDPHNLGSILRTAEATGVHGVIIPKKRAVGLTTVVAKTSAGAVEYVPVARVGNLNQLVEQLKEAGIWIVGTDDQARSSYKDGNYSMPLALVIGNEGKGISHLLKRKCDYLFHIPMQGRVSSLNASVATGVLLYEVLQSRGHDG